MKVFNKFLAVLCSATLIVSAPITAFAADEAPSSTAGAGNILAYSYDTVTVPTTIKITFNPQQLAVRTGGTDAAPVTSTEQIVSLNYGIANKATDDKKIIVGFAATATSGTGTAVTFVDAEAKAQAKTESNSTGAEPGELKMYLAVASASAVPKADASTDFEVTVVADGKNTENASAGALSNVVMTAATTENVAFAAGTKNYAFANIGYKLGKASYALQDAGSVGFETAQSAVKDLLEMTALGDVDGFTFVGKMNPNANWTTANITALSIVPIYTITDADGTETAAAASGVYKQIALTAEEKAAEPDKPLTAEEVAAAAVATSVSEFKAAHTDVVTLLADPTAVDGSEEELTKINAAIAAFEALDATSDAALITALAANEPSITAETLGALKTASEAAAVPAVTTYALTVVAATGNLRYTFAEADKPTGTLTAISINGTNRPAVVTSGGAVYNSNGNFVITKATVDNANMGIVEGGTTIVATIGGAEYTFTY